MRVYPCPPLFSSNLPNGARTIRHGTGAAGLAMFGGRTRTRADRDAFRISLAVARFGALNLCHARHTAVIVPRLGNNFGHTEPTVRLIFMLEGEATMKVGGRTLRLAPGGGAIMRGWEGYVFENTSAITRLHVDIPAQDPLFAAVLKDVAPVAWAANSPLLLPAAAALVEMVRNDTGATSSSIRGGLQRMAEALTLSLLTTLTSSDWEPSRARQRADVLAYIVAHHAEVELTASSLAADFGLSTRSLQRLFADEELGVAEHIAAVRCQHALALLRDPHLGDVTLEEIAERSGFGSISKLRRAIRTATGLSPKEHRSHSRRHLGPT